MSKVLRRHIPGVTDVNDAFSKKHLRRTKQAYDKFVASGGYHFGDLSAAFCNLDDEERRAWDKEIDSSYPADVQKEIVRTIEAALLHKNNSGKDESLPITFKWIKPSKGGPSEGIRTTYNASQHSYLIEIIGYISPMGSSLSERRDRYGPQRAAGTGKE